MERTDMDEIEVWIVDDKPDDDVCEQLASYARRHLGNNCVHFMKNLGELQRKIDEHRRNAPPYFVLCFIDYYETREEREIARPALRLIKEGLGERFMANLFSNFAEPDELPEPREFTEEWARLGGESFITKRTVSSGYVGQLRLLMIFEEARRRAAKLARLYQYRNQAWGIIGQSHEIIDLRRLIERVAPSNTTVLLLGECGTGKELCAKALHDTSDRSGRRFVPINIAAINEGLVENELFGHEKGGFTGAHDLKRGLIETAGGGTLFLDEIGEIPLTVQVKLLRVLQEREFARVGGTETHKIDVRVIAATNRDLRAAVEAGTFREDLYYRLSAFNIEVPPLRKRRDDIPLLVEHFIVKFCSENGENPLRISEEAQTLLFEYDWPGNVRELEHAIEMAVLLSDEEIQPQHLPKWITADRPEKSREPLPATWEADLIKELADRAPASSDERPRLPDWRRLNEVKLGEDERRGLSPEEVFVKQQEVMRKWLLKCLDHTGGSLIDMERACRRKRATINKWLENLLVPAKYDRRFKRWILASETDR